MKRKFIIFLLIVLLINVFLAVRLTKYYAISCDIYADTGIKGKLSNSMNSCLNKYLNEKKINYSTITNISRTEEGQITAIAINSLQINTIANELSILLFKHLDENKFDFGIPLGNALGSRFLSGRGPEIDVTVIPIGAIEYEISSELLSGGINQTLHRISISLSAEIDCLAPFNSTKRIIECDVIVAETLIVGNLPNIMFTPYQ